MRSAPVLPIDIALLEGLTEHGSVVRAARAAGISRDGAVYRIRRLEMAHGRPIVFARRGGRGHGGSVLTPLGRRLLRTARGESPRTNRWVGTYRGGRTPRVEVGPGADLTVAFRAAEGARVAIGVDPEAFVVARRAAELSAVNALRVEVDEVRTTPGGVAYVIGRWAGRRVRAALTVRSVERLGLGPGRRALFYAKAVAVRRLPTRESPRR